MTAVLLLKVTPVFEKMFTDFGSALPAPTQFVIDLSNWLQSYFFYMVGGIVARRRGLRVPSTGTRKGRKIFDKVVLKLPIIGPVIRKVAVARFTRTLGTMISSGVPILDALDVTAKTAGNRIDRGGASTTSAPRSPRARTSPARCSRPRCSRRWWCR